MRAFLVLPLCACTVILFSMAGCSDRKTPAVVAEHAHAHVHGPHDGELIELGDEEYHAELIHDDEAGKVTIYILDGAHEKAVPIEAGTITIKMVVNATPVEFKLGAERKRGTRKARHRDSNRRNRR